MFNMFLEAVGTARPHNDTFELIWGAISGIVIGTIIVSMLIIIIKYSKKDK